MSRAILTVSLTIFILLILQIVFIEKFINPKYIPLLFILGIIEAVLAFLNPYIICFFSFRKREGGMNAVRLTRFARKYKQLYHMKCTDIASDRYLSYLKRCIASEKNKFNRFSLVCSEFYAYASRNDVDNAYHALEEMQKTFDPEIHYHLDFTFAKLSYAMQFCSYEDFRRLCDDNPSLYEDCTKKYETLIGYASLVVHDLRETGNYQKALEELEVCLEMNKRDVDGPVNQVDPTRANHRYHTYSHMLLDKADLLFRMGDRERCLDAVNESDMYAQKVTCPLTPLYIKDHMQIMQKLYPPRNNSSALD
ncbi:MAG: hypothetical protein GXY08_08140 [Ruminococcus sp.]|nr:hypothetical protein [Ruminococcus sp.]